jgi:beta-glucanase (GH16 family)
MVKKSILVLSLVTTISFSCQNGGNRIKKETYKEKEAVTEYRLLWADEFDGDQINPDNWSFEIWDAGKVNNEWQQYVKNPENYKLKDGKLHITATRTGKNEKGGYASTRLSSRGKKEITYGRVEFRAKMPYGIGTWPALWMLGANITEVGWPWCGELVILEYVGFQPDTIHSNVFTMHQSEVTECHRLVPLPTAEDEFHIYGMTWTTDSITFYLDDPSNIVNTYAPDIKTAENWPFNQPFFFIMNFAVGGSWGGKKGVDETIWPQSMIVDYVRVYQLNQKPEAK